MRAVIAAVIMLALPAPVLAQNAAADLERQLDACASYAQCFHVLDANDHADRTQAPKFAARLEKFGERAKQELLKRASGPEPSKHDWYVLPNFILRYWNDWSERDIESIEKILRANPESPIGWALVKIGTPRAIKALVEDAAQYGSPYMPDMIAAVFDKALPYVDEGLAGENWQFFLYLLSDFEMRFALPKDAWAAAATDSRRPPDQRIAALRALSALKIAGPSYLESLHPLLHDANAEIRFEATRTVRTLHGKVEADVLATTCPTRPNAFVTHPNFDEAWEDCLLDFANNGAAVRPLGDVVLRRFLESANGADRADGATALALIGYTAAIPKIAALLDDQDWRVVFAATRALGWFGAKETLPAIERVASKHWLKNVRDYAQQVSSALKSPAGRVSRPAEITGYYGAPQRALPQNKFNVDAEQVPDVEACNDSRWTWDGRPIVWRQGAAGFIRPIDIEVRVAIGGQGRTPAGELVGMDFRENGGRLTWVPERGPPELLHSASVSGIALTSYGAVAVLGEWGPERGVVSNGPRGVGFALRLNRDDGGKWSLSEIARFPRGVDGLTELEPDLYAALSGGRVVVFSSDRILGLASCSTP